MEKIDLEEQFILRLTPELAEKVHTMLQIKPEKIKKYLKIRFDPEDGFATVYVGKIRIQGFLRNLPTITESYKTNICNSKSTLYKTADICQMLDCTGKDEKSVPHGVTPPLKNVKKKRFRKTLINTDKAAEMDRVLKELYYLLRTDLEAVSSKFEILEEGRNVENEVSLFGHLSSDSENENEISKSQQ